jgi:hypothetical protein
VVMVCFLNFPVNRIKVKLLCHGIPPPRSSDRPASHWSETGHASVLSRRTTGFGATLSPEQVPAKVRNPPIVAVRRRGAMAIGSGERRGCSP